MYILMQIVKEIEKLMIAKLQGSDDSAVQLKVVRAMRNARLQGTKEALIEVAETSKETALITAAIQALAAVNKDFPSLKVSS